MPTEGQANHYRLDNCVWWNKAGLLKLPLLFHILFTYGLCLHRPPAVLLEAWLIVVLGSKGRTSGRGTHGQGQQLPTSPQAPSDRAVTESQMLKGPVKKHHNLESCFSFSYCWPCYLENVCVGWSELIVGNVRSSLWVSHGHGVGRDCWHWAQIKQAEVVVKSRAQGDTSGAKSSLIATHQ